MKNIYSAFLLPMTFLLIQGCSADSKPYLDESLDPATRTEDLLSRMTLEEKVGQMVQFSSPSNIAAAEREMSIDEIAMSDEFAFYPGLTVSDIPGLVEAGKIGSFLKVSSIGWIRKLQESARRSRLGIPLLLAEDSIHGNAMVWGSTVYPSPIGLASSWNLDLVEKSQAETAYEMRTMGLHWNFTPNVDIARNPKWGRIGETFGEDPLLVTKMGAAVIRGLHKGNPEMKGGVLTTVKHFVAGGDPSNGKNFAPMDVSERTLREVYFPPFRDGIMNQQAGSVMAAHNEVNGVPAHASRFLLTDVLRDEWGFDGIVISDWLDVGRLMSLHRVAPTHEDAVYQAVHAGLDMNMHGPNFAPALLKLVRDGRISEERIDLSVRRILNAKFRLGLFEENYDELSEFPNEKDMEEHFNTALELARQSIILLKNQSEMLPILTGQKIFITGQNADSEALLGDWVYFQPADRVTTFLEGMMGEVLKPENIDFLDVGTNPRELDESQLVEATERASGADVAIVVVGGNSLRYGKNAKIKTSGENAARSDINLIGRQLELVKAVEKSGTPTLVILINGRPISEPWISDNVDAIIEAWEPGGPGGRALAEIIFGKVNPSGKLPVTIPYSVGHTRAHYSEKSSSFFRDYVDISSPSNGMVNGRSRNLFDFGYGQSYTTFTFENLKLSDTEIAKDGSTSVIIDVTNSGEMSGAEVVQLYIRDEYSEVTRPVRELKNFQRVFLTPGERTTVEFEITPDMLSYYNLSMKWDVEPGDFSIMVGSSSRVRDLMTTTLSVIP